MFKVMGGVRGVSHVQCDWRCEGRYPCSCDGGGVSVIFKVMVEGRQPCSR